MHDVTGEGGRVSSEAMKRKEVEREGRELSWLV
jgi:hypothetical protein